MAKETSNSPDENHGDAAHSNRNRGRSPDPKLRAFLRQAAAVIAAERGLNDISTAKLQLIAERLELPKSAFNDALQQLQRPANDQQRLHHYEKAFVGMIEKEMTLIKSGILTIGMENKLIEVANSKYQISEIRAQQLIQKTAARVNVRTISHTDAEHFAEQLIVDVIGANTSVEAEEYESLYSAGKKWGQPRESVDRIVGKVISRNRSSMWRKWIVRLLAVALLTGIGSAGYFGFKAIDWGAFFEPEKTPADDIVFVEPEFEMPEWVSTELQSKIAARAITDKRIELTAKRLFELSVEERGDSYEEMARSRLIGSATETNWDLLNRLYFDEPDEPTAFRFVSPLVESISSSNQDSLLRRPQVSRAYRAIRILGEILFADDRVGKEFEVRQAKAIQAVCRNLDLIDEAGSIDASSFEKRIGELVASSQWNYLLGSAFTEPSNAAVLLDEIERHSRPFVEPDLANQYRARVVRSLMDTDVSFWRTIHNQIRTVIRESDANRLEHWIALLGRSNDREFDKFLMQQLVERTKVKPATNSPDDILAALESYRVQRMAPAARLHVMRIEKLNSLLERMERKLAKAKPELLASAEYFDEQTPQLIAQVAFTNTVLLMMVRSLGDRGNSAAVAKFDSLIDTTLPEFASRPSNLRNDVASIEIRGSLTASESRTRKQAIEKLANSAPKQTATRATALRSLVRLSRRIVDLSYSEALELAGYLLSDQEDEWLTIEKSLPSFAHWPTLKLAIADRLPTSNVNIDQGITLATLLTESKYNFEIVGDWKSDLASHLLISAHQRLDRAARQSTDEQTPWNQLKEYLSTVYEIRGGVVGESSGSGTTGDLYEPVLAAIWQPASNHRLRNAVSILRASDLNEIDKCAGAVNILADSFQSSISSNNISKIEGTNAGNRLLSAEMNLMRMLSRLVRERSNSR